MNADHVVVDMKTQEFTCTHCGQRYLPNLPSPINLYVAISQAFVKSHRRCKPAAKA